MNVGPCFFCAIPSVWALWIFAHLLSLSRKEKKIIWQVKRSKELCAAIWMAVVSPAVCLPAKTCGGIIWKRSCLAVREPARTRAFGYSIQVSGLGHCWIWTNQNNKVTSGSSHHFHCSWQKLHVWNGRQLTWTIRRLYLALLLIVSLVGTYFSDGNKRQLCLCHLAAVQKQFSKFRIF